MEDLNPGLETVKENPVENKKNMNKIIMIGLIVIAVALGTLTGYFFSGKKPLGKISQPTMTGVVPSEKIAKGAEFGTKDTGKADNATGVVEKGGIDGEGTHKLIREGGPSQTLYMTSSVLDLDQFVGRKIQVWGETNRSQKAGWFMDVIKVKVLE